MLSEDKGDRKNKKKTKQKKTEKYISSKGFTDNGKIKR